MARIDLIGQRFYRLVVLQKSEKNRAKHSSQLWECICDCGTIRHIPTNHLKSGNTKSCGCLHREGRKITHGHGRRKHQSKELRAYTSMKSRCLNANVESYPRYGGRGIKICERWLESFENFLSDIGPAPTKKHTIERIDVNGDYEPENCRWATLIEQANNKRNNIFFEWKGERLTLSRIAASEKIKIGNLRLLMSKGEISLEEAVSRSKRLANDRVIGEFYSSCLRYSDVQKILADKRPYHEIGAEYGVCKSTICTIKNSRHAKGVPMPTSRGYTKPKKSRCGF